MRRIPAVKYCKQYLIIGKHYGVQVIDMEDLRVLRLEEVKQIVGVSRSTIYSWMKDGHFPESVSLGPRSVGWLSSDISAWIQHRVVCND